MRNILLKINSINNYVIVEGHYELLHLVANDEFLYSYIPDVKAEITSNIKLPVKGYIKLIESNEENICLDYPKAEYSYIKPNIKDIISFIEYYFERLRQDESSLAIIHGSCAIYKNQPIIFWGGASGMGKTRLALGIQKIGGQILYDEKIVISLKTGGVVSGINSIYNNKDFYESTFGDKLYIPINNNLFSTQYNVPLYIYGFIRDNALIETREWDSFRFNWHIYEELSRKIRGTSKRFFNFTYPVQSIDTQELAIKRNNFVKKFTEKNHCYYVSGNEQDTINYIEELIEKI
jgi:hypothetical protein